MSDWKNALDSPPTMAGWMTPSMMNGVPLEKNVPLKPTSPLTSSACAGLLEPMPTEPVTPSMTRELWLP